MKKISHLFKKIIDCIWFVINKILVVPITKMILFFKEKFSKPGKKLETWLSRPNTLLIISLILAFGLFLVIDRKIVNFSESSAEVLKDQSVTVLYDEDNYVVEGVPEAVDITLIGSKASLYIANQSPTGKVIIDLWGLKPGQHKVGIGYDQVLKNIKYSVNPSVATVIIYEKISENKTLTVDLLNQDTLDSKMIITKVEPTTDTVVIKGASDKVAKVATVKALVDINSLPKIEIDKVMTVSSTLKAYDELGNVVDVEISPSKVDVNIEIKSPSKTVPIIVVPTGNVVYNMGISGININNGSLSEVTLYGAEEILAGITNISVNVDVNNLKESKTFKIDLPKPNGVKHMSVTSVDVGVTLSDSISNKEITNVSISARNLGSGLGANPIGIDTVTVKLKGVTTLIEGILADDIEAYVDLTGLGVGEHEVEIKVTGTDLKVEYLPSTLKLRVKIYKK